MPASPRVPTALLAALLALAWCAAAVTVPAQEQTHVLRAGTLIPVAGDPIDDAVLVFRQGRIVALGPADAVDVPADAVVLDHSEAVVMPGLVDTHSHLSTPWAADGSHPLQPEVRALDGLDVRDATFAKARAGGITTVNIMPGSGHLMSGQTVYLKLRDGRVLEDLAIRVDDGSEGGRMAGGLKMANGTNSQDEPPFPGTRAKSAAMVREMFVKAQEYGAKRAGDDPPDRDLALDTLLEVLDGTRVVHHHTHRADDIMTVLRLRDEFGFRVVLQHVSEGYKVADQIAAAGVPCSVIVIDSPGGKIEAIDMDWGNAGALERAGAVVGFHTDDPVNDSRLFLRSAAFGVRAGMGRDAALAGMTLAGARMLDLDERIGTLEVGKDADFVVLSGDPLSVYTRVRQTWVEGAKVFDLADPDDALMAEGGYGAGQPRPGGMLCCFGKEDWR